MTGYERAIRTLTFQSTDYVPTWGGWIVSEDFFEYITGRNFWQDPRGTAIETYRKLGVAIVLQVMFLPNSPEEWRTSVDPADLIRRLSYRSPEDIIDYVGILRDPNEIKKDFDFDTEMKVLCNSYRKFQEELGSDILCMPSCSCTRFTWYTEFGYENYLMAFILYPDIMKKLFNYSAEEARLRNMLLAELVKQNEIPPYFFTGNDICGKSGPMVSPEILRSVYFPYLKYALEPLVNICAEIIWHSDGYIIPIINDLIDCGISGFQGFQEETGFDIGDIANKRVRSGRKPLIMAGLAVDRVLPFGKSEDVEHEIERIIKQAGAGGGLIIGTSNTAGPDCPNENLEALYTYKHAYDSF